MGFKTAAMHSLGNARRLGLFCILSLTLYTMFTSACHLQYFKKYIYDSFQIYNIFSVPGTMMMVVLITNVSKMSGPMSVIVSSCLHIWYLLIINITIVLLHAY